jgi:hypothetical protein
LRSCQCGAGLELAETIDDPPVKENYHKVILLGGLGAVATGIVAAASGQLPLVMMLGILVALLGAISLVVSQVGTRWELLTTGQKAAVIPGVTLGMTVGIVAVAALAIFLFIGWAVIVGLTKS